MHTFMHNKILSPFYFSQNNSDNLREVLKYENNFFHFSLKYLINLREKYNNNKTFCT
jgi:hypothetical protein